MGISGWGVLLCAWWKGDGWFKRHLRDVFSSGMTPIFISQSIMKKLFFENLENLLFLAIFAVFLSYFRLCKIRLNLRPFMFLLLGWDCWGVNPTFLEGHFGPKWLSENVSLTPQHSQPNNRNMKGRWFRLILHKRK